MAVDLLDVRAGKRSLHVPTEFRHIERRRGYELRAEIVIRWCLF